MHITVYGLFFIKINFTKARFKMIILNLTLFFYNFSKSFPYLTPSEYANAK